MIAILAILAAFGATLSSAGMIVRSLKGEFDRADESEKLAIGWFIVLAICLR